MSRLENLDLSENCKLIESFGALSSGWNSLKKLRSDCEHLTDSSIVHNGFKILSSLLADGCLPLIQELRITCSDPTVDRIGRWKHLKRLDIVKSAQNVQLLSILGSLLKSIEMGSLPALNTICLLTDKEVASDVFQEIDLVQKFSQKGVHISIIQPHLEEIMINADLI